jgi:hypothetical protein
LGPKNTSKTGPIHHSSRAFSLLPPNPTTAGTPPAFVPALLLRSPTKIHTKPARVDTMSSDEEEALSKKSKEQTSRLFRVRRTVMQMLRDRGYDVPAADLNLTKEGFVARFGTPTSRDDLTFSCILKNSKKEDVKVRPLFRSSPPAAA